MVRAILAAVLLLIASTVHAGDEFKYLEFEPDSTAKVDGGLIRLHFVYAGGCFEVLLPSEWVLLKTKQDFTRYGDSATRCVTAFTRWETTPGKSLRDEFADYQKSLAEWDKARQARLSKKYKTDVVDERIDFDESHLVPTQLGKSPDQREAIVYFSDASSVDEKIRKYVNTTNTSTQIKMNVETKSKLSVKEMVHVAYSFLEGKTRVQIQFNCNAKAWETFEPKAVRVIDSVTFPACKR